MLDGLEVSEVNIKDLEFSFRFDSEYYQKEYLYLESLALSKNGKPLKDLTTFLIGPFGSAFKTENYENEESNTQGEYRYIRGKDVKQFFLMDDDNKYIPQQDFLRLQKYAVKENDILISVVGTLGNASIVQSEILPAIFSCKSTIARNTKINQRYLLAYLNSNFGRKLLLRKTRGAVQAGLNLDDLKTLIVPCLQSKFQNNISELIKDAHFKIELSKSLYAQAEVLLLSELGLKDWQPSEANTAEVSLADSFLSSGRLDAEYYQPKYEELNIHLDKFNTSTIMQEFEILRGKNFNYDENGEVKVIKTKQVTRRNSLKFDVDDRTSLIEVKKERLNLLQEQDIVFASMGRGSLGKASIFYAEQSDEKLTIDSTLRIFRIKKNAQILPEVAFVWINSDVCYDIILRYEIGTTGITSLYESDISNIPVPILSEDIQEQISNLVRQSQTAQAKSKRLLALAKEAVEVAIEQGEEAAEKLISSFLANLE